MIIEVRVLAAYRIVLVDDEGDAIASRSVDLDVRYGRDFGLKGQQFEFPVNRPATVASFRVEDEHTVLAVGTLEVEPMAQGGTYKLFFD